MLSGKRGAFFVVKRKEHIRMEVGLCMSKIAMLLSCRKMMKIVKFKHRAEFYCHNLLQKETVFAVESTIFSKKKLHKNYSSDRID